MIARNAWEVYSKTAAVSVAMYLAIKIVEHQLQPQIHDRAFRWATAFAIIQAAAVLFLSVCLLSRRAYAGLKKSFYAQIRSPIQDRILALAFEGESWSSDVPSYGPTRHVLEESIAHALATLKASGRDRVAQFAVAHGYAAQWVKAFSTGSKADRKRAISLLGLISPVAGNTILSIAIHDKHSAVRAEAYRALLILGDHRAIDLVFRSVLGEPLLMRALLADDLKRHASFLMADTIPSMLEKGTSFEAAGCFEFLIAWKRVMPSFDVKPWLSEHSDAHLFPLALALLSYVPIDDSIEDYLTSALSSSDLEVQCAAAGAAGRLNLERLIPVLSAPLNQNKQLALACGHAIAQMGKSGEHCLESIVTGSDRRAAAVAMEALEQATVGLR